MKQTINTSNIRNLLTRLWHHLSRYRQRQFVVLVCLIFICALADVVSLGAVIPFLTILTRPQILFDNLPSGMGGGMQDWGFTSPDQMVLPLTVVFIVAVLIAGAIRILFLWASTRVALSAGTDIGIEIYRRTLYQPYYVHTNQSSSEVISGISTKTNNVVFEIILPLLTILSSSVLLVAITGTLIAIDPIVALVATVSFATCYGLITLIFRSRLHRNSKRIAHEQTQVVKVVQEGLGGIRDVLLDGTQDFFCNVFRRADHPLKQAQANNILVGLCPRYIMEALGMILFALLAYGLSLQAGGLTVNLPILGALAIAAQRMLPALQMGYSAWACILGTGAALGDIIRLLDQPLSDDDPPPGSELLTFKEAICFDAVRFRYSNDGPWVLNGLNLTIPKGARVGFVGNTGSGKSTTLDLLMGLLRPTEGQLTIDGHSIGGYHTRAWQRKIAHVPQNIYLADTTLSENIAFGVMPEAIDMDRVKQVARQAQIADFIESQPEGYASLLGEQGIRLSGGQRQRLGIARALYKQASVLVFDEATSALDNETEKSVMKAVEALNRDLTILIIAHRLTTVEHCDKIIEMKNGQVVAEGTYEQLLERSPSFRKMASTGLKSYMKHAE